MSSTKDKIIKHMSIDTLQRKGLFHHRFKYVGFVISGLCVLYALIHHFVAADLLFHGLYSPNMLFAIGLLIVINSKEASEDERVRQIRSYVQSILGAIFIGFIFFDGMGGNVASPFIALSAVLTIYVLVFHYIYYFNTQWIEENQGKSGILMVVLMVGLLLFYDAFWLA